MVKRLGRSEERAVGHCFERPRVYLYRSNAELPVTDGFS